MSRIVLQGYILVPEAGIELVCEELETHIKLTRQEPGCLCFRVTPHPGNPLRFDVCEEFCDRAAFDLHQQRVRESRWGRVTQNVERFYTVSELPQL